jgi:hypothetical protein
MSNNSSLFITIWFPCSELFATSASAALFAEASACHSNFKNKTKQNKVSRNLLRIVFGALYVVLICKGSMFAYNEGASGLYLSHN